MSLLMFMISLLAVVPTFKFGAYACQTSNSHKLHNQCNDSSSCPTWFYCNKDNNCQCEEGYDIVWCNNKKMVSAVPNCHCVTTDMESGDTYAGLCVYSCGGGTRLDYYLLLKHSTICSQLQRTGILCGECLKGLRPPVMSYNLSCVECSDGDKNWWKFVVIGFVPLTFFYLFILFFNINVTSSHLHGVVFFSQLASMPQFVRVLLLVIELRPIITKLTKFTLPYTAYGILTCFVHSFPVFVLMLTHFKHSCWNTLSHFIPSS